jgi:hypothetical protein
MFSTGHKVATILCVTHYQVSIPSKQLSAAFLRGRSTVSTAHVELLRNDSLEMTATERADVREAVALCNYTRVIVAHGTSTLVDTAHSRLLRKRYCAGNISEPCLSTWPTGLGSVHADENPYSHSGNVRSHLVASAIEL